MDGWGGGRSERGSHRSSSIGAVMVFCEQPRRPSRHLADGEVTLRQFLTRGEWAGPLEEIQYTTTASLKNFWPGKGNTCEWPRRTRQRPLCRRRRSSCRSRWPCGACRRSRCTRHLWQREPRRLCLPAFSRHCLPSCRSASPIVHRLLMLPKSSLQSKQPNRHLLSRKTPVWSWCRRRSL